MVEEGKFLGRIHEISEEAARDTRGNALELCLIGGVVMQGFKERSPVNLAKRPLAIALGLGLEVAAAGFFMVSLIEGTVAVLTRPQCKSGHMV